VPHTWTALGKPPVGDLSVESRKFRKMRSDDNETNDTQFTHTLTAPADALLAATLKRCKQETEVGADCRHVTRPSVQLPGVSGVDSKLGLCPRTSRDYAKYVSKDGGFY